MNGHTKKLLAGVLLLALSGTAWAGENWNIGWFTIDAGGTMFSGGSDWTLAGTIGQFEATEAGALSGGGWTLTGGFWAVPVDDLTEAPIFSDRFER